MKKLISLTVVFAILCAMTVCPVAFADEATSDNAYEWMDISKLPSGSSGNRNYGSYIKGSKSSDKVSYRYDINGNCEFDSNDEALEASVAVKMTHSQYFVFGSMDFSKTAPKAIEFKILNGDLANASDPLNSGCYINVYAFPVGTTITTCSQGTITKYTVPGGTESTDASEYLLLHVTRYAGQSGNKYDREKGDPRGLSSHSYKIDATKAAALIDSDKDSNPWMIVIGCGTSGGNYCAFNGFQFHEEGLNAENVLSVYQNHSSQSAMKKQTANSGDAFATNLTVKDSGMSAEEYEAYITIDDVNFGDDDSRQLAAVFNYGKGGNFSSGDFILYIDANDKNGFEDTESYATLKTAVTSNENSSKQTHGVHKVLLSKNITGVHDVKVEFSDPYMAALYTLRFEEVDPEDVYGDATITESNGTYRVNVPIRKEYIKGAGKCIVALYDVDSEGKPTLYKADTADFTIASTQNDEDYGWDYASATLTFSAADIEGRLVKAFLWRDMDGLVPLTPASSNTTLVNAAQ